MSERESMEFDLVIVGGGPAGLAAAIRAKQLANEAGEELEVVVLEKGGEIGAHILSGLVLDPKALDELIPDWRTRDDRPIRTEVNADKYKLLGPNGSMAMPTFAFPPFMHNHGCYIGSLANVCRWLGERAEELEVQVFPGFAASEVVYGENGEVRGVVAGVMGIAEDGSHKPDYEPGMELLGKYVLFAEGARGSLTKEVKAKYDLEADCDPQKYGIGLKEVWKVPADHPEFSAGYVQHTFGWPVKDKDGNGGGFLYHFSEGGENYVSVGYVVHLNYKNPHLSPYDEFQRYKHHDEIAKFLKGGKREAYGARAITSGGIQSIPKLSFPGGALIGCSAGFVNLPRIKGTHNAMKTGMLAAEEAVAALREGRASDELGDLSASGSRQLGVDRPCPRAQCEAAHVALRHHARRGARHAGHVDALPARLRLHSAAQAWQSGPRISEASQQVQADRISEAGWCAQLRQADQCLLHQHLSRRRPAEALEGCGSGSAEIVGATMSSTARRQRYCPAGVYEWMEEDGKEPRFQINSQNCIHCKTCDIKDPNQNINWVTPEGGGGPAYPNM